MVVMVMVVMVIVVVMMVVIAVVVLVMITIMNFVGIFVMTATGRRLELKPSSPPPPHSLPTPCSYVVQHRKSGQPYRRTDRPIR